MSIYKSKEHVVTFRGHVLLVINQEEDPMITWQIIIIIIIIIIINKHTITTYII